MKKPILYLLSLIIFLISAALPSLAAESAIKIPSIRISGIEIRGNKNIPAEKFTSVLKLKAGDYIAENTFEEQIKSELKALYDTGLLADEVANFAENKDGLVIIYQIAENPVLASIEFEGNTMVAAKDLLPLMTAKAGEVLNTYALRDDIDKLAKYYSDKGFNIRISDVACSSDGRLEIKMVETKIGKIVVTGNDRTKTRVIARELGSKEGGLLNFNEVRAEQRRIINLGFFDEVTPEFKEGSTPDEAIYTITVKERRTGNFGGGVSYSGTDGLLGYVEITEQNLLGNGQMLNLKFEAGLNGNRNYEIGFNEPWIGKNRTSLGFNLYNKATPMKSLDSISYTEKRFGGNITLGRPLDLDTRVSITLKAEDTKSINSADPSFALPGDGSTHSVTLGMTRDTRDNFMNPGAGYRLSGSVEVAGGLLGGLNQFSKYNTSGSTYIRLKNKHVIAMRLTGGLMTYGTSAMPEQEAFRLGGSETLRGYSFGEFVGDSILYSNLEYRIPIIKTLSCAVFADAGKAWNKANGFDSKPIKYGAGLGVRLDTPLGLLRLDYGMNKNDKGEINGKTYFSIGQTF